VLKVKKRTTTPSFFIVFTFGLAFDYFKESGGASLAEFGKPMNWV
jgi:hypothetical protein